MARPRLKRDRPCPEGKAMKRVLLSLSLGLFSVSSGFAQYNPVRPAPAAALGLPRASLGTPKPASDAGPNLVPTQHIESPLPDLPAPVIRDPKTTPPSALVLDDPPKEMPKKAAIDEKKVEPKVVEPINAPIVSSPAASGPFLSSANGSIVAADEPLFGVPVTAPPFINRERFSVSGEYLMWWANSFHVPPLVTTGPVPSDGIPGLPGVSLLYGNQNVGSMLQSGYRLSSVYWCNDCWGIDGRAFFLGKQSNSTSFSSDPFGVLARPFGDTNPPGGNSELVASTGVYTGGIVISNSSYFWGGELNARRRLYDGCGFNIDGLIGYRNVNLTEQLNISERAVRVDPTSVAPFVDANGTVQGRAAFDNFRTSNHFNGGQIGLATSLNRGRWVFDFRTAIAFGVTQSSADISGAQTTYYTNGNAVTNGGGLLALATNSGHHTAQTFSIVPEATFNIGYNITPRCRIFVGYNALYWSRVLRPGDQISTTIDSARIPNFGNTNPPLTANPAWTPHYSSYFVQGVNFGLSYRW